MNLRRTFPQSPIRNPQSDSLQLTQTVKMGLCIVTCPFSSDHG